MADRFKIKFNIEAVDRFTATMTRLERKLDSLKRKATDIPKATDMNVDLKDSAAAKKIDALQAKMAAFDADVNKRRTISFDTASASRSLNRIARMTDRTMNSRDNYVLGYNTLPATDALRRLNAVADGVTKKRRLQVDANTGPAKAKLTTIATIMAALSRMEANMRVDLVTRQFDRAFLGIKAKVAMMQGKSIVMHIKDNFYDTRTRLDRVATTMRNVSEIFRGVLMGLATSFVSILSPAISSSAGMIGSLGVMIGVVTGATLGLASAFVAAGFGVGAWASVAIPAIKGVLDRSKQIAELDAQIMAAAKSGDMETANALMKERQAIFSGMTKEQQNAHESLRVLKKEYKGLVDAMEPKVLTGFSGAMEGLTKVIDLGRKTVENSVDAVNNLVASFNQNLDAPDVRKFFSYLEEYAGPSLENVTKAAGNFVMGFLNMMRAFAPLSKSMSEGFLQMSESFRKWADGLSESEKFKAFTDYVRKNWPVVKQIFGDAIMGIIELFKAFAPYAEDWMAKTRDMVKAFRDFAEGLGQNKKFQEWIQYIRDNAPKVTQLIGNIIETLVEIGIAMAPVGAKMLDVANAMFEWIINFRRAHPLISNIVVIIFSLLGGLLSLAAPFFLIIGVVKSFAGVLIKVIPWIIRIGAAVLGLAGPIGIGIALVAAIAFMIYRHWGTIGPWVEKIWSKISAFFVSWWAGVKTRFAADVEAVKGFIDRFRDIPEKVRGYMDSAKTFISNAWEGAKTSVSEKITAMRTKITEVTASIKSYVTTQWNAIKTSITNASNSAKTGVTNAWNSLKTAVTNATNSLRNAVMTAWNNLKTRVTTTANAMRTSVTNATNSLKSAVTNAWNSLKITVTNAANSLKTSVVNAWNTMKSNVTTAMNSLKSSVTTAWSNLRSSISTAVSNIRTAVSNAWNAIKTSVSTIMSSIVSVVQSKWEAVRRGVATKMILVKAAVRNGWNAVMSFLRGINLAQIGKNIIEGLIGGIKAKAGALLTAATSVVSGAIKGVTGLLKMKSPSRLFRKIGMYTIQGMEIGILREENALVRTITRVAEAMTDAFNPELEAAMQVAGRKPSSSAYNAASAGTATPSSMRYAQSHTTIEVPLYINGKEFARATASDVTSVQNLKTDIERHFNGGGN